TLPLAAAEPTLCTMIVIVKASPALGDAGEYMMSAGVIERSGRSSLAIMSVPPSGAILVSGVASTAGCFMSDGATRIAVRPVVTSRVTSVVCPITVARQGGTCLRDSGGQRGNPVKMGSFP